MQFFGLKTEQTQPQVIFATRKQLCHYAWPTCLNFLLSQSFLSRLGHIVVLCWLHRTRFSSSGCKHSRWNSRLDGCKHHSGRKHIGRHQHHSGRQQIHGHDPPTELHFSRNSVQQLEDVGAQSKH
jgi:hypothetical protein